MQDFASLAHVLLHAFLPSQNVGYNYHCHILMLHLCVLSTGILRMDRVCACSASTVHACLSVMCMGHG